MPLRFALAIGALVLGLLGCEPSDQGSLVYPQAHTVDRVDDYHGTPVADPYRWLEDVDAPATRTWIANENAFTRAWLEALPQRAAIRRRLESLWSFERYGLPRVEGGRTFYTRNDGRQNHSVLHVADAADAEPRVLLNPNELSADGTVALRGWSPSPDGRWLAYALSTAGSDWQEWRVRDVETGRDRDDVLRWVKFSGAAWTHDSAGFFYARFDPPPPGEEREAAHAAQRLHYHRLGSPQESDPLVYESGAHGRSTLGASVTDDGRWLVISVRRGGERTNALFCRDLSEPDAGIVPLADGFDGNYDVVGNDGSLFWVRTDRDAPKYRVVAVDLADPAPERWRDVLPESEHVLRAVRLVGERFVTLRLVDAHTRVDVYGLDGRHQRQVELPGLGTASGFGGHRTDAATYYGFAGFTRPRTIYRYDLESGKSELWRAPQLDADLDAFETRQVFYPSADGTRVPMFLVARRGLEPDGRAPVYLYGYGGFNSTLTPSFSVPNLLWLELGGVLALANLRGGGEYGEAWHRAAMKTRKQTTFDDFIAAAEWLIASGYTSPERLAIGGRSNGGLLVGAVLTQRPDLFGAALPGVGVLDMLRFHRFTIGWAWVGEYGSADDPNQFRALHAYSPLHNVRAGTRYPPTLIYTSDHDDRVVPGHSFKFAAALQAAQAGPAPVLIRIDVRAGHGGGKPVSKRIEEWTDLWGFTAAIFDLDASGLAP